MSTDFKSTCCAGYEKHPLDVYLANYEPCCFNLYNKIAQLDPVESSFNRSQLPDVFDVVVRMLALCDFYDHKGISVKQKTLYAKGDGFYAESFASLPNELVCSIDCVTQP